ncbi:Brp/Blh family beta-carotene 15,15'-dioxygenase [Cyclobacterium jeungdonense]|uniref:Probable beta-carotene 15,15'-dioxygenase n=1 Tax=Cyclobacterium jeungdonense TaxID=708087 RepID=A0ABT8C1F6_9BACT|nr:Brp/Blh family beta-carotene 15,15'-dioxygenase [Cyclobacterium jeungdonense]MDN3686315.1 Brp/Blh family beta-carotene 15,15'-dioxygenase [Cyclobacterium jeungdonense]
MRNIENIGKVLGIFISLMYLIFLQGNETFEWILIGLVLVSVGIPHGSLDHLLVNPKINTEKLVKFILKYLSIIFVYLLVWIFLPVPALIGFLAMSAYHFGQSHFIQIPLTYQKKATYFFTGFFYLCVIFWGSFDDTSNILGGIVTIAAFDSFGWYIISGSFLVSNYLVFRNKSGKSLFLLVEMIALGLLLYQLPLLMGFIIYFGFWHALPSMSEEFRSLKLNFRNNKLISFITRMIPFTTLSLAGIGLIIYFAYQSSEVEDIIFLFFVLISLISAPHVWYMNRFLESSKD